ncbi:Ig-like domain-containing protein [Pseudomonas sp. NY15436]|uniref:Ig-like domain-containing protein n=1 Tax=Pseudomonas sp. NY15436 TaxID=3400359 RepID=UPI003A8A75DB
MAVETIGLVAVTENAAKKVAVKAGGKTKAHSGTKYLLQVENSDVAPENVTVKRVGKDLQISFEGSEEPDLTITDFYADGVDSQLYGVAEDGQLYAYVRTDGEGFGGPLLLAEGESAPIALGGDALADGAAYQASTFDDAAGFVLWPWLLGLAGVGAAAAAIIHHNKDGGGHHTPTSAAPTNTKAMDDVGPIQGQLANGDVTDDSHPAISGNGVPGATIHIYDNGQEIGTALVAADGTWSFTPELADGPHSFDITQVVPGQSLSDKVKVIDIVVDTTSPAAPIAEIDGPKGDDGQTHSPDNTPAVHGEGEPGDTIIVIFPTGESVTTVVAEDGTWVAPQPTQPLPEGNNDIKVIEQDPAGNQTEITVPVIIDTIAPAAPEVHLDPASDTGIKGDDITSETRPTIDGKTEPGAEVTVTFPTGETIITQADENGDWSVTPTQPLPEGNNDITVIATDPAGNPSEPTVIAVVIDTRDPSAPEAHLDPASDSGIQGDDITNDTKPTIDGKTEPGATVEVTFPTGEAVTTTADANGDWSVTPTQPLPEGKNDISVIATDPAGNQSEPTVIAVVIDTQAPGAPDAWLDPASDSGTKGDGITNDNTPTIGGTTEPGADVVVILPTGEEVKTKADENGDWSVTPTLPLAEGENAITVIAIDPAGNKSEPTEVKVIIDTTAPDADKLAITGVLDDAGLVTGNVENGGTTDDSHPTISGTGTAGDTVTVYTQDGTGHHPIGSAVVDENGNWSLTPELPLNVGLNELTAVETDVAGNSTTSEPYGITLDMSAPAVPTIDSVYDDVGPYQGFLQKGDVTDDNTPTFAGSAPAGSTVTLYDGNHVPIGSAIADASGHWNITPDVALADGKHEVYATATSPIGVASEPTGLWPFSIDTGAPSNVSDLVVTDDVGDKQGPLHDGDTTDDNRPTFSGDAEPNGKVIIYDNGEKLGEADVDADGKWEFTPTEPIKDGEHAVTTEVLDEAGNSSGQSDPLHVIVDTQEVVVTIDRLIDDVGAIQGDIKLHGVTDDTRPEIQGSGKAGSTITVFDGEVELGSTVVDAKGHWSFTPSSELAEGAHSVTATATDKAGNTSTPTNAFDFSVDTTAPNTPSIDGVTDDVGSIQGPIENGGKTDDSTPTLSGNAEAGSTVTVYDNGEKMGSVVADSEGKWSYTPTTPISEGQHDFTVDAADKAGNTSPKSDVFSITTDYTAPDAPAITGVEDKVGTITGNVAQGGTTDDPRPEISGTGTAGDTITVYANDSTGNHKIGSAVVDENGNWSMTPETPLNVGLNDLTVVETDPVGNSSAASEAYSFTFDPSAPAAPVIVSVYDDVGPYQGFLQKGDVSDDNQPTVAGTAEANSTVKLYDGNGLLIGSTTADSKGNWSITTSELTDGEHEVYATATNAVGVVSEPTGKWDFTVDTSKPSNVSDLVVTDNVGDVTGPLHEGDITDDNRPTFSGDAEPNGKVIIYDNGTRLGEADVDADGKWEFTPTTPLADGDHALTTEVLDPAGNSSGQGDKLDVIVDTSKNLIAITHVIDDVGSIKGDIAANGVTDDTRPEIQGTGKAGSTVTVYDGETRLGTTTVDARGNWTFTPTADLADGAHTISATATDKAGNVSDPAKFSFNLDTTAPTKPSIDSVYDDVGSIQGPVGNGGVTDDSTPTLSGKAEAGSTVVIYDNGNKLGNTTADKDGNWSYTPTTPISEGEHTFTVDATDKAGNVSPKSDPFTLITDYTGPNDGSTKLTIDNVTSDNAISSVESQGNVTISGKVTGDFTAGDKVTFVLDATTYSADVRADGTWGVDVPGSKLVDDAAHEIDATLVAHDAAGNAGAITASHSYQVQLNAVSITGMSKDSANDMAHSGDFITQDGGAGRGVYGTVAQALTGNQKVQVSFDGGATWKDAATNNLNWTAVDTDAHTGNWTIQARVVDGSVVQTDVASQNVTLLGSAGGAPTITGIPDAVGAYTTDKAADGSDVNVSLAGTNAKAGDTLHIVWGDTTYDQVLTNGDIASGTVTANVPTQQTTTQGGQWDFAVTAQIVTPQGQVSLPSSVFQVHGQGWETLAIDDLNRNVTTFGSQTVYQGGGITITSNGTLTHLDATASGNAGLYFDNPSSGATTNYAQINFTTPVDSFSINISSLQNNSGGSRVVVYDTEGNVLSDSNVLADGSGGVSASAKYSFTAPVGADIGKVMIYGDGVNSSGAAGGGVVLDTLKFSQVHHVPGYNDTFTNEVGKATSGTGYHSDEGHFTLTSQGTVSVRSAIEHNPDGSYLYIGTGTSAISNSAAIFTFDQPVQSISYNLWGLETQQTIANNGSRLEVYDTNGALIFDRYVVNNGGSTYSYEQVSYTAPEGTHIGKAVVYQDKNGTLLDNFTTTLATSASSGQSLVDHGWETYYDGANATKEVSWQGQSFAVQSFSDGTSLNGYHSTSGTFTVTGTATKTASGSNMWANATSGSMYVAADKTAVITFDSARSTVEIGVTGIEPGTGNAAVMTVYSTDGTVLDTVQMLNPTGTYDIQSFSYESSSNNIGRIEITGDQGGTHVTHVSSSILSGGDIISMAVDPVAYFAQDGAHIHGSVGLDTLKLTGANQVLDLTRLIGDHDQGKIASIEKFDITGTGDNTLKISLNDVLNLGETNLFRADGKVQVMVDGDAGDRVELSNLHDHGTAPGVWQSAGTASIGGETYNVYSYSNLDAEVLIKQAVTSTLV